MTERLVLIPVGGGIGSALRFLGSVAAARWLGPEYPYGTLIVNLDGAFIIVSSRSSRQTAWSSRSVPAVPDYRYAGRPHDGLDVQLRDRSAHGSHAWREATLNVIWPAVHC